LDKNLLKFEEKGKHIHNPFSFPYLRYLVFGGCRLTAGCGGSEQRNFETLENGLDFEMRWHGTC